jgi:hypothetical protein
VTNEYIHVEVACKFYLLDDSIESAFEGKWIGSNRKDTLLDKLNKLRNKQFPLLHRPELVPFLESLKLEASHFKQQQCILSSFYIPLEMDSNSLPLPYQKCIVGRWLLFKNFEMNPNHTYAIPSKKEWLLPNSDIDISLSSEAALVIITASISEKRAVQVYEDCDGEVKKFFIVWW